jgi:hypothetical protein
MSVVSRLFLVLLFAHPWVRADGPGDNVPERVRPIPPPGIVLKETDRRELEGGVDRLGRELEALRETAKDRPSLLELIPDVQVFHRAVDSALRHNEFFHEREVSVVSYAD